MATGPLKCDRCGREENIHELTERHYWIGITKDGYLATWLCPDCQTPEEQAAAEVNDALLEYKKDDQGRMMGRRKGLGDQESSGSGD